MQFSTNNKYMSMNSIKDICVVPFRVFSVSELKIANFVQVYAFWSLLCDAEYGVLATS